MGGSILSSISCISARVGTMVKAPLRTLLFISMVLFSLGSVLGEVQWSVLRCGRLLSGKWGVRKAQRDEGKPFSPILHEGYGTDKNITR
jgi:hypothetical protein